MSVASLMAGQTADQMDGRPKNSEPTDLYALVAVTTLGLRPTEDLFRSLQAQSTIFRYDVVVIDNSPTSNVDLQLRVLSFGFKYVRVVPKGFAEVRNAALRLSSRYDFLLFIDDDEIPSNSWVEQHLQAALWWHADVVVGPVAAAVDSATPAWSDGGRVVRPKVHRPDGPFLGHVGSGNTTLRTDFVRDHALKFDTRFNASGGEDTDFFIRCRTRGARIVWAQKANVVERLDPERLTLRGLANRNFRMGRTYGRNFASREQGSLALFGGRKVIHGILGLALAGAGVTHPPLLGRGICLAANAFGAAVGALLAIRARRRV